MKKLPLPKDVPEVIIVECGRPIPPKTLAALQAAEELARTPTATGRMRGVNELPSILVAPVVDRSPETQEKLNDILLKMLEEDFKRNPPKLEE